MRRTKQLWARAIAGMMTACHDPDPGESESVPADIRELDGVFDGDEASTGLAGDVADFSELAAGAIAWQDAGAISLAASGESAWMEVPFAASPRYVALRVRWQAPAAEEWCLRLTDVVLASGTSLVSPESRNRGDPPCLSCGEGATAQRAYGFYVFPNGGGPLAGPDVLRARADLRPCIDPGPPLRRGETPSVLTWEYAVGATLSDGGMARLGVGAALAAGSTDGDSSFFESAEWARTWKRARAVLSLGGVVASIDRHALFGGPPLGVIKVNPSDSSEVDGAYDSASEALEATSSMGAIVPVVIVRCLPYQTLSGSALSGYTPRIPGGAPIDGVANAVFLALGTCSGPRSDPEQLGLVLAHELGHYLGLFHTDEPAGANRASPGAPNVMHATFSPEDERSPAWSPAQVDLLRRHPSVFPDSD